MTCVNCNISPTLMMEMTMSKFEHKTSSYIFVKYYSNPSSRQSGSRWQDDYTRRMLIDNVPSAYGDMDLDPDIQMAIELSMREAHG
jgi:hypothetical protein